MDNPYGYSRQDIGNPEHRDLSDKLQADNGWLPIESAPRAHLSRFLVYATPRSTGECAIFEAAMYDDKRGSGVRLNDQYGASNEFDILRRVTHWQPLPSPPAQGPHQ